MRRAAQSLLSGRQLQWHTSASAEALGFVPASRCSTSSSSTASAASTRGMSSSGSGSGSAPPAGGSAPSSSSQAAASGGGKHLNEAAAAAGVGPKADASDDLLKRLKDPSIVHTGGFIGGKWTGASTKGAATFQVCACRAQQPHQGTVLVVRGAITPSLRAVWGGARRPAQVRNPATGQVIATLPLMKGNETRAAIAAADAVFPQWSKQTAKERAAVLKRCGAVRHRAMTAGVLAHAAARTGACHLAWNPTHLVLQSRWHQLVLEHTDDLATIMTMECGKPRAEALGEIASGYALCRSTRASSGRGSTVCVSCFLH